MNHYKTGYVRCWTCVGNGLINIIKKHGPWGTKKCPDCNETGKDERKTRELLR